MPKFVLRLASEFDMSKSINSPSNGSGSINRCTNGYESIHITEKYRLQKNNYRSSLALSESIEVGKAMAAAIQGAYFLLPGYHGLDYAIAAT